MPLARHQFLLECDALLALSLSSAQDEALRLRGLCSWSWLERPDFPALKCLTRTVQVQNRTNQPVLEETVLDENDFTLVEEEDESLAPSTPAMTAHTSQQYIVYSATYSVPAFYFTLHDAGGAPLTLDALLRTRLFHAPSELPGSGLFPLLSQGDHPVLGTPCWYLHPCETSTAMEELLRASEPRPWLEVWLMLIGTVLDLRT